MIKPRVAIAHYTYPNDIGGVTTWIVPLLKHLSNQPVELAIHLHDFPSEAKGQRISTELQDFGINVFHAPRQASLAADARQTFDFLNYWQPTVFLPQCLPGHFAAAAMAGDQGLAWALTVHSDDPDYWANLDTFPPHKHRGCAIGVSKYLSERITTINAKQPAASIPYGADVSLLTASFNQDPFRVIYCGRLQEEQKRIDLVLETLIKACQLEPRLVATVVGDGRLEECQEIVHCAGMDDRIAFTGRLNPEAVKALLPDHQAMLLMSDYEGLPVALLEAMAAGVVPVVRDIPSGIPELIHDGKTGLLVSDSCDQAAAALVRLSNEPDLWNHCSENSIEHILNSYERNHCFKAWDQTIQTLHLQSHATYPLRFNASLLRDLPPILSKRYPRQYGPKEILAEKFNTASARFKAKIRTSLLRYGS